MGSTPSKDAAKTKTAAAVGRGKPTAKSATKFKIPKFHIIQSGEAPSATTTATQDENKNKAFRDPSVTLRRLASTAKLMKIASTTKLMVDKMSKRGTTAIANRTHRVRNIFATPLDDQEFKHFKPPVHPKSPEVTKFILAALGKNFVFEQLSEKELDPLVQAFESIDVPPKEVIIRQGDVGDYFYIIGENDVAATEGECVFEVDGEEVGRAGQGDSFGELALLYSCPRAATVTTTEETRLFRVDQKTFRFILQNQTIQGSQTKGELLQGVDFLKDLDSTELLKLASVMTPKRFNAGDYLIRKGEIGENFYLLSEGSLQVKDIGAGDSKYEDAVLEPGKYVGERALVTGEPRAANVVAKTDGMAFCIDKNTFDTVLGQLSVLILRSQDKTKLSGIKCIKQTNLDPQTLSSLAKLIVDENYNKGAHIFKEGKANLAGLYLVREGKVSITDELGHHNEVIEAGGYFGHEQLLADAMGELNHATGSTAIISKYTATVTEDCTCGVLTLAECGRVMDTNTIGKSKSKRFDSITATKVSLESLKRHTILGAGTFGQVWLVSREAVDGKQVAYALKIQSKFELCRDGQAKAVVDEKNILASMHHPFICNLAASYQDPGYVYMLMEMVQGGELYGVIHTSRRDGVNEADAKFYAAGITEGLAYMHRRGFVYRDLKPENVMIDAEGYPVIVDFGFAKYVTDKTYTLCGTPLYLAPEVILNRGHTFSADHWSLGVLTYEMITGYTPFYYDGMEQMDLFRAIVKGVYKRPWNHAILTSIVDGLLCKVPAKRLGSLAGGEEGIYMHPWFQDIDFAALRNKQIKAPYVPKIKDPLDSSNFEDWSHLVDKTKERYPKLKPAQVKLFDNF